MDREHPLYRFGQREWQTVVLKNCRHSRNGEVVPVCETFERIFLPAPRKEAWPHP
ncbi:hypothetical protein LEMLEM_LOCUS979 [Lemmus lemmus]